MTLEMKIDPFLGREEGTLQYMFGIYQDVQGATPEAVLSFAFDKETGAIERFYIGDPPINAQQATGQVDVEEVRRMWGDEDRGDRAGKEALIIRKANIPDEISSVCKQRVLKRLERYNQQALQWLHAPYMKK